MDNISIADAAKQYTEYDMIQDNTDLPDFPHLRSQLLLTFLQKSTLGADHSELYSLVTSLAQLGLDTHDLVAETNEKKGKKDARARQLKILAGDYFSSRFYQLLSQAGQVEMTRQIATAICEVNRIKMNLYTRVRALKMTAEEYLQLTTGIKMQLFLSFSRLLDGSGVRNWPEMLQSYTRCEVLLEEISRLETNRNLRASWGFWHVLQFGTKEEKKQLQHEDGDPGKLRTLFMKYNIKAQLHQMLETQFKLLTDKIRLLEPDKFAQDVYALGEPFLRHLAAPRALEEG